MVCPRVPVSVCDHPGLAARIVILRNHYLQLQYFHYLTSSCGEGVTSL
jgi:hypothetical protein